jgi:hypothetical protein
MFPMLFPLMIFVSLGTHYPKKIIFFVYQCFDSQIFFKKQEELMLRKGNNYSSPQSNVICSKKFCSFTEQKNWE